MGQMNRNEAKTNGHDSIEFTLNDSHADDNDGFAEVNQASVDIQASIKYKLVSNLYRQYLGMEIPYAQIMNKQGDVMKAKCIKNN